ncbi:MAG: hypothetical protein ABI542_08880 [Gemmatimonadota bacterium]
MTMRKERFAADTTGAPEALVERARAYLQQAPEPARPSRLAMASRMALEASMVAGARRECALDLLAADALITLALLEVARAAPETLLDAAVTLRHEATASG